MGLLNNSSQIQIDAVLTDIGREALSRNDGSFEIVRFSLGDDEIDYTLFTPNTGSLQQDINILNTPIFEASVNDKIALQNQLLSISNPSLQYLPQLSVGVSSLALGERTEAQTGKTFSFNQTTQSGRIVPSEIVDGSFLIQLNNSLLYVVSQTPVNISNYGTAQYIIPRTSIGANQGAQVSFSVAVQALSSDTWNTLGVGTVGSRTITTTVRCQGVLSGLSNQITVTINEQFNH